MEVRGAGAGVTVRGGKENESEDESEDKSEDEDENESEDEDENESEDKSENKSEDESENESESQGDSDPDEWEGMLRQYDEALEKDRDQGSRVIENPAGVENMSTWVKEMG
jgi:hypothetical protein